MESPEWNKNIDSLRVLNEIKQKIKKFKKKMEQISKMSQAAAKGEKR